MGTTTSEFLVGSPLTLAAAIAGTVEVGLRGCLEESGDFALGLLGLRQQGLDDGDPSAAGRWREVPEPGVLKVPPSPIVQGVQLDGWGAKVE